MRHPWRFLACLPILTLSALAVAGPARCAAPADTASVEIEGLALFGMHPFTARGGGSAIRAVLDALPIPAAPSLEQVLRNLPALHVRTNSRVEAEISVRGGDLVAQSVELLDPSAALEHPENLPEVSGSLRAELPLPHRLALGAGTHYVGDQFAIDPDSGDLTTLPARARVDVDPGRMWQFGPGSGGASTFHAWIAAENLTDEAIYDAIGLSEPGRTIRLELRLQ